MFISNKFSKNIWILIYKNLLPTEIWIFSAIMISIYISIKTLIPFKFQNYNKLLSVNFLKIYLYTFKIIIFLILTTKISILPFDDLQTFIKDGTYKTAAQLKHFTETHLQVKIFNLPPQFPNII